MQQATQIPLDEALKIFGVLVALFLGTIGIIGWFAKTMYADLKMSLNNLHDDLKPLTIKVEIQGEKIEEIKEGQKELNKWVNNHDGRLQSIERKVFPV